MKYKLYQPQAINEIGNRKNQEDSIYPTFGEASADSRLFLVCDGMGGYERGEVASATAIAAISRHLNQNIDQETPLTDNVFTAALSAAYDALDQADHESEENKMGTTLTMLCFHRGGCLAAHIGDSRIYHLRPSTGEILYRSRDHSLVQQLYELGELSYSEMKTSPKKNIVLKAMQPHQEQRYKAELVHITDIRPGDYFYLCSDGMLEQMEDEELMSIVADKTADDSQKRQRLIEATAGNADNHSAYLIHIERVENEESDAQQPNDEPQARAANKALNDPDKYKEPTVEEPDVTMIRQGQGQQQQTNARPASAKPSTTKTAAAKPAAARRPASAPHDSGAKKWLVPLIILLVAILTGFTIYNLMGSKKDATEKKAAPEPKEEPDRIEFKKDDAKEGSNTTSFPSRPAPKKPAAGRDKQTDEVNSLLEGQKRREQQRREQEKEAKQKKEQEEAQEAANKAKETAEKKAQAEQQQATPKAQQQTTPKTQQDVPESQPAQPQPKVEKELQFSGGTLKGTTTTKGQSEQGGKPLEKGKQNE